MGRQDRDIEIAGNSLRGFEIVVQGNDCVAESLAKVIDYANHAQWYAADPETREHVQDVLATQGGTGGVDRFRKYLYGGHSSLAAMRLSQRLIKSAAVARMFNSFKHHAGSLRREVGLGMWHS
jgi:hypothetical protein